jgi:phosphonatase-like hydrolase
MRPQLVVFDLAGTTVNDPDGVNRCLRAALSAAEMEVDRQLVNEVMGLPKPLAIRTLMASARPSCVLPSDTAVAPIYQDFVQRMIAFYQTDPSVHEIPGTEAVFARLQAAGITVAVDTGFARNITDILLDRLGWVRRGLIQASVTSDEVPRGRPHPDMINKLMSRFGIAAKPAVVKVGDTPADLEEGTNAGCGLVVGVTSGSHTRAELERCPHTHLIESVADLPAILEL